MSAVAPARPGAHPGPFVPRFAQAAPRLALLGTGTVGSAFVARCERLREQGVEVPAFAWLANSRASAQCVVGPWTALAEVNSAPRSGVPAWRLDAGELRCGDIAIDATASDRVAGWHGAWLARGVHVVSANKLGNGAGLARARAIAQAQREAGTRYGDSATVGAGLPLLRSIRGLVAGGDRIEALEGVLSGSLAWLFDRHDGTRPFSALVREARAAGYTEPDPRIDLSGEDVRRKLLILARAAGLPLEARQVRVDSLLPEGLAAASADAADAALALLDAPLHDRLEHATRAGARLRFIGGFGPDGAEVGLRALPASHPLCAGGGTDNLVAISSCRYRDRPLGVRGPGAGAGVTAAALLDDVLRIVRLSTR